MEEATTYKLGDISTMKYGKLPPKYINEGNYPIWSGYRYVGKCNEFNCNKGDIIIVARGVGGTGDVKIAKEDCYLTNLSIQVKLDKNICQPEYFYYSYLLSNLKYLDSGSAQSQITIEDLKRLEVTLPPLEQQHKITDILKSIDEKIELNRQINDNLEQQAQALYKSWFVDFEPFKDGEFIESELGKIPEGWQCIPFSMFVTESKAKTGKIGIKEYSVTNNGIFPRDAKYNKSLSQSSTKNKLILYGDLVFGMSRDILNWGVMQEEQGGVSSAYTVYNINSGIVNSTYLELFIKSRIHLFSDLIRPAAREGQGIDKSVLQTKVLLYPPQEVLDTFWPLYNSVTNQIQTTTTEINCLGDVRDTLLPKLMSGELKINEIDC